jgi:hypothetical protein
VPAQKAVYLIYDVVCSVGDQTYMFNPEFARIGHSIRQGFILDRMWECKSTDILTQYVVQKFNAMQSQFFVM